MNLFDFGIVRSQIHVGIRPLIALVIACNFALAWAQIGPPLITNDPDTPGDGNWEINVAVAGTHGHDGREISAPDVDVNYDLGARLQLSVHVPLNHRRTEGDPWHSGSGLVEMALRWRIADEERVGLSMAIQPHWVMSWSSAAIRLGLAPPYDE